MKWREGEKERERERERGREREEVPSTNISITNLFDFYKGHGQISRTEGPVRIQPLLEASSLSHVWDWQSIFSKVSGKLLVNDDTFISWYCHAIYNFSPRPSISRWITYSFYMDHHQVIRDDVFQSNAILHFHKLTKNCKFVCLFVLFTM